MIQLNPQDRLTFDEYLIDCRIHKTLPNAYYVFLHPFMLGLQEITAPSRPPTQGPSSHSIGGATTRGTEFATTSVLRNNSDEIIETVWHDFSYVSRFFWINKKRRRAAETEDGDEATNPELESLADDSENCQRTKPCQTGVCSFVVNVTFGSTLAIKLIGGSNLGYVEGFSSPGTHPRV